MASELTDIRRLLPVLEMSYQAEQLKMAKILSRIRTLRSQLADLDRPKQSSTDGLNIAVLAGANLLWEQWAEDRKTFINRELAVASRDREQSKGGLKAALLKLEATRQLEARSSSEAELKREQRSSW